MSEDWKARALKAEGTVAALKEKIIPVVKKSKALEKDAKVEFFVLNL